MHIFFSIETYLWKTRLRYKNIHLAFKMLSNSIDIISNILHPCFLYFSYFNVSFISSVLQFVFLSLINIYFSILWQLFLDKKITLFFLICRFLCVKNDTFLGETLQIKLIKQRERYNFAIYQVGPFHSPFLLEFVGRRFQW